MAKAEINESTVLKEKGVKAVDLGVSETTGKNVIYAHPSKDNPIFVNIPLSQEMDEESPEQVETVIINGETTRIRRGVTVPVTYEVYSVLKGRYPRI